MADERQQKEQERLPGCLEDKPVTRHKKPERDRQERKR